MSQVKRFPTGIKSLDKMLRGGIEGGVITEIFGEAGSGKTNLVLWCAKKALERGGFVIHIDTEGLSPERISQIFKGSENLLENYLIIEAKDLKDLKEKVENSIRLIISREEDSLLVIDSYGMAYRRSIASGLDPSTLIRSSYPILFSLLDVAQYTGCACIITNQVYSSMTPEGNLIALGGEALKHFAKVIIRLEKTGIPGERIAILEKHRSIPEGGRAKFRITEFGLEDV